MAVVLGTAGVAWAQTPAIAVDRARLLYGSTGWYTYRAYTPPQTVTVTITGGTSAWTASSDQPWLTIQNGSGSATGTFTATVRLPFFEDPPPGSPMRTAAITVTAAGAANSPLTIPVRLTFTATQWGERAFGQIDTPVQDATGVVGAIALTGWALDDVAVGSVQIYRNCLDGEIGCSHVFSGTPLMMFIGNAAFLPGARPDVEALFPDLPQAHRAGWGYMLLTNMLPDLETPRQFGGQGTLTLYAYATDASGCSCPTLLGRTEIDHTPTTITMANATIAKPFGAIDTPAQGGTVGGVLNNFGWVLTPDSNTTGGEGGDIVIPTDGSRVTVFIDGLPVALVAYNQCRGDVGNPVPPGAFCNDDVASIFGNSTPQATFTTRTANPTLFRNLDAGRGAIGAFTIDTATLSNGLHTIAWSVTDSAGRTEGIGSRFFNVLN